MGDLCGDCQQLGGRGDVAAQRAFTPNGLTLLNTWRIYHSLRASRYGHSCNVGISTPQHHFKPEHLEKWRQTASCATFLVVTLLLPLLLTAPVERDIRFFTLINTFYAAEARVFTVSPSPSSSSSSSSSLLLTEGRHALRTAIFMRHSQRVLDALPSGAQVPPTDVNAQSTAVVSVKVQRSNIVSISVSPGISRADVVAPLLAADSSRGSV